MEARGARDMVMEHAEYIESIRRGMFDNVDVLSLPPDAFEREERIQRAKSHLLTMLEDPDLIANSTADERAAWRAAAEEP
jgi:hypothetical protein